MLAYPSEGGLNLTLRFTTEIIMKLNYKNIITFALFILMGMWCTHTTAAHTADKLSGPDPIIVGELLSICQNDTLTYFPDNITPGSSIEWEVINGTIVQNDSDTITVAWSDINPGRIILTVTSPGCVISNEQTLNIRSPEMFSLDAIDVSPSTIICDGDTAFFNTTALYEDFIVDESDISYQWFVNGIPVGTDSPDFVLTNAMDGDMVHAEATSTFNCLANSSTMSNIVTMTITPRPVVNALIVADPNPVCPGDNIVFSTIRMNEGPQPNYEWQVNGVTVNTFSPFYSQLDLMAGDTVTFSVLSTNACALNNPARDTVIIQEIEPFPATITIEPDMNPACAGELVIFSTTLTNEGDTPTFQWFVNGMPALNQTSDQFGLYTFADGDVISAEMMSSSACASNPVAFSNEVILELGGSFTTNVTLDAPNPFCIGDEVEFTAIVDNPAPNPMFTWDINGTQSITTPNNQIILPVDDGDLVTLTYTADFGECFTAGDTMAILVMEGQSSLPVDVILVVDVDEICRGDSMTFTPLPENGGADPVYQWFIDGIPFGDNMDSYTTGDLNNGDRVSVELTTSLNCAINTSAISNGIQVQVSDVTAEIVSVNPGCNDAGTIEVTASGGISNTYFYNWSNGQSGNIATDLDTGTYTVTVTDEAGCTDTASADITAVDAPQILDGTTTIASCGFEDGTISIDFTGGTPPYEFEWMDDTGTVISTDSLQTTVGTGTYTVIIDGSNCSASATFFVDEVPPVNVVAPDDVTIDLGDSIRIVAFAETLDSVSYQWSPEMGVSCLTCPITDLRPFETTTYTLTMTQAGGCTSTDQITVTVREDSRVFIPNIFSPNNDGVNDVFVINTGPGVAQIRSFRIFDRWGALVYNVENVPPNRESSGWDGTFNRTPQSQDVYVYFVELELLNGRVIDFRGDVSLVR